MTINSDAFGNYYVGNYISGEAFDVSFINQVLTQALGSSDRFALSTTPNDKWRIDWRPNIPEETLTGAIPTGNSYIGSNLVEKTLNSNARLALSNTNVGSYYSLYEGNIPGQLKGISADSLNSLTDVLYITANNSSISIFVYYSDIDKGLFFSQGLLNNSALSFPDNIYTLYNRSSDINTGTSSEKIISECFVSGQIKPNRVFGTIANYDHIKLSDGSPTTSEVELYLRDTVTNIPYGYIPNLFKWKVDGTEVYPNIGDTVRLNMSNAVGDYAGHGIIYCKVVGRLGLDSTSNVADSKEVGGDYILMRTYG